MRQVPPYWPSASTGRTTAARRATVRERRKLALLDQRGELWRLESVRVASSAAILGVVITQPRGDSPGTETGKGHRPTPTDEQPSAADFTFGHRVSLGCLL